jgi:uncharacterized metal-binding protein/rhodanese-related sulfurtransferase
MNCLNCQNKLCKTEGKDCTGLRDETIECYSDPAHRATYLDADRLVAGGRAGTLSRLQEIAEFCRYREYGRIGIAYCFAMEDLARETGEFLEKTGLKVSSYRCTLEGIREEDIDGSLGGNVNCNPIGQANTIERDGVELVLEMGLCLGHDILFHKHLKVPHTVFMVKDRVHRHNPARALGSYTDFPDSFLESMDKSFRTKLPKWLDGELERGSVLVLDVRVESVFRKEHIEGSVNIPLTLLPGRYTEIPEDKRKGPVICVCNGSVQSAYAISYLSTRGFGELYILSGGLSRFKKEFPGRIREE